MINKIKLKLAPCLMCPPSDLVSPILYHINETIKNNIKNIFKLPLIWNFLFKVTEIKNNPFNKINNKLLVARVEWTSSEKGTGWIIPFNNSEVFKIINEFSIKALNSLAPIILKKIIKLKN